jgi:hypothetical protein
VTREEFIWCCEKAGMERYCEYPLTYHLNEAAPNHQSYAVYTETTIYWVYCEGLDESGERDKGFIFQGPTDQIDIKGIPDRHQYKILFHPAITSETVRGDLEDVYDLIGAVCKPQLISDTDPVHGGYWR